MLLWSQIVQFALFQFRYYGKEKKPLVMFYQVLVCSYSSIGRRWLGGCSPRRTSSIWRNPKLQLWDCGINSGCTTLQARVLYRLLHRWTPPPVNVYCRVVVSVHLKTAFATKRPFSQFKVFLHCATGRTGL